MRTCLFLLLAFVSLPTLCQELVFDLNMGKEKLKLEKTYINKAQQEFTLETFRFYVSNVQLSKAGETIWQEPNSYYLIDAEKPESLDRKLSFPKGLAADTLVFMLGIDSLGNVSDQFTGDLDPLKGMYWTWQSGYINFKIEGTSPVCNEFDNRLSIHLGGYLKGQLCVQRIAIPIKNLNSIHVPVNLEHALNLLDLSTQKSIMIPGREAMELSQKLVAIFKP